MLISLSSRIQPLLTLLFAILAVIASRADANELIKRHASIQNSGLKDECVAISNAMALNKLGFSVSARRLVINRITKNLGREFEAASETLPDTLQRQISSHVLLNRPSEVNSNALRELTRRGALVLCLSTKRLLGDRSGKASPDHAVHIREIVRKQGVDYMVIENCWGPSWGRDGIGYVPVSSLRELPYVYGLFLQKRSSPRISSKLSNVLSSRPFRIAYASGRSYPQP